MAPIVQRTSLACARGADWKCIPRSVPRRRLKEMLVSTSRASRPRSSNSRRDQPRAKKPRSSSNRSGSTTKAPPSSVSRNIIAALDHPHFGDGDDEAAAALAVLALLFEYLVGEVPRQQQAVVGHLFEQPLGRGD